MAVSTEAIMDKTLKQKAMEEVIRGLREGTIKVEIRHICGWCKQSFNTTEEFEAHLVEGKTTDPATGQKRRICPN